MVSGALTIDRLDIDPYIAAAPKNGAPSKPHPKHSEEWGRDRIKLDALHEFDADLSIDTGALKVRNLMLGRTHMALSLRDDDLHAQMGPMALYGGSGNAQLEVDARAPEPRFHNAAQFQNVALAPFLSDTIGVKQIEGTGTVTLDVSSQGASADAIMRALSGKGSIDLRDGRVTGVKMDVVSRAIQAVLNGAEGPGAFTDYSSMTGSFTVTNGALASNDFHLAGPLIQARRRRHRRSRQSRDRFPHHAYRCQVWRAVPYQGAVDACSLHGGFGGTGVRRAEQSHVGKGAVQRPLRLLFQTAGQCAKEEAQKRRQRAQEHVRHPLRTT